MAKQEVIANSKAAAFLPISACRKKCRRAAQGQCNRKMNRVIFNVFKDEDKEYYESELQRNA